MTELVQITIQGGSDQPWYPVPRAWNESKSFFSHTGGHDNTTRSLCTTSSHSNYPSGSRCTSSLFADCIVSGRESRLSWYQNGRALYTSIVGSTSISSSASLVIAFHWNIVNRWFTPSSVGRHAEPPHPPVFDMGKRYITSFTREWSNAILHMMHGSWVIKNVWSVNK